MTARRPRDVAMVVGVCAVVLILAGMSKGCRGFWDHPASFLCHSDIRALYPLRELDRDRFPYLEGDLIVVPRADRPWPPFELRPVDGANEYPVLTGVLMWLPSIVSDDADTYLLASAMLLAPFGLATARVLGGMTGRRALVWSASPLLLLYAFHNWDLVVVAASVAGFWSWWRGRPMAAAVCFGIGGALKLYPVLFLLPLVLDLLHARDRRGAVRAAAAGAGAFVLINLPIAVLSPSGWAVAYRFQALRMPNHDSLWGVLARTFGLGRPTINALSAVAAVAVLLALMWGAERRTRRDDTFPFLRSCAALLTGFLLVSKVHSPQFALWLVPLFVLVRVRLRWYVLFVVTNLVLYVAIFGVSVWSVEARDVLVTWSVAARTVTFALLVIVFLRAQPVVSRTPAAGALARAPAGID
jgi:uncharacterized membrane protein